MHNSVVGELCTDAAESIDLHTYNAAFHELGLRWHWNSDTYQALKRSGCKREGIRVYLQAHQEHLLNAYDADFLIDAILAAKERCGEKLMACGISSAYEVDWAAIQGKQVGA